MEFEIDEEERTVSFEACAKAYSLDAVQISAHIFSGRANVFLDRSEDAFELALQSKKKSAAAELEVLAREFLNEMLNQEYRFVVGAFNRKISNLIVTQALLAARGGEAAPASGEETDEFKVFAARLMREAQEEIARTMPRKIAPQGAPIPPPAEDASV
ncbi:MAG: hypothetical protein HY921_02545 [Elusimicrobia bacterium]|nr:hypothetical protein [Elusimicrobiota bacterium]